MCMEVPLLDKNDVVVPQRQLLLSPLDVLQSIYDMSPALVPHVFGKGVEECWEGVREDDPRWVAHGALRERPDWKKRALPIVLHGDAATFTTRGEHSMFVLDWRGLLAERFEGWVIPIWAMVKACSTKEASDACWKRTVHLFNAALDGGAPTSG